MTFFMLCGEKKLEGEKCGLYFWIIRGKTMELLGCYPFLWFTLLDAGSFVVVFFQR